MTVLSVDVDKRLGDFSIATAFETNGLATALFGSSGSGKTSIVNMIAGLLVPDRGRITFGDMVLFDSAGRVDVPPARRGIGYVFQEGRLFPHLSVAANLDYGRWMRGRPRDPAATQRVVDLLGIGHILKRRPGALSGGERQRVAIGRALLMDPKLLLLDEPLAGLGPGDSERMVALLASLKGRYAMLLVEHDVEAVFSLADRISVLVAGRIIASGSADEIRNNADVRAAYLGEQQ
jgi:molybdate transport system ATP-binding protein